MTLRWAICDYCVRVCAHEIVCGCEFNLAYQEKIKRIRVNPPY